jgi:NAD(P)-dependent dehydrogenase (short-subunit alcohol dehydrogenase family)
MTQQEMRGKVCVVTGSSSGLGKATALGLASMGATVILACRDQQRGLPALLNEILKYTPGGAESVFANNGLDDPAGLAFDKAGNLYVANAANNTIEEFTPGGGGNVFASTGLSAPTGLAFDSAGNLYVANSGNNTIEKFTSSGVGSLFASNPSSSLSVLDGPQGWLRTRRRLPLR